MKRYAHNDTVEWMLPSGVTSYMVAQNSKGKYAPVGHGFEVPFPSVVFPQGAALNIDHTTDTATIVERPDVAYPVGTKVALFTETEARAGDARGLTVTDGSQYLGTVEKTPQGWEPMPNQPQLSDQIATRTYPWSDPGDSPRSNPSS